MGRWCKLIFLVLGLALAGGVLLSRPALVLAQDEDGDEISEEDALNAESAAAPAAPAEAPQAVPTQAAAPTPAPAPAPEPAAAQPAPQAAAAPEEFDEEPMPEEDTAEAAPAAAAPTPAPVLEEELAPEGEAAPAGSAAAAEAPAPAATPAAQAAPPSETLGSESEEQFLEEEAGISKEERVAPVKEPKPGAGGAAGQEGYEVFTPPSGEEAAAEEGGTEGEGEMAEIESTLAEAEKIPSILTTLEECKRVALINDRRVQVALKQIRYEKLKVQEAERTFLPGATMDYQRQEGDAATGSGGQGDTPFNTLKYGIEGEQILFNGGKLVYNLKQAKNNLEVAKKKFYQARQEAINKVEKAYYTLVKTQMTFEVQADLSKAAESALSFSREAYRQGLNSYHEFLNVQSQTDQTYYQLLSYQQEITLAELDLRQACGIDQSVGVQIDAVLTFTDFNFNYSLDECLELGFKNRPDLAVNELTTLSDLYGIKLAMAEGLPLIKFIGRVGKNGQMTQGQGPAQEFKLGDEWDMKFDVSWVLGANTAKYLYEKNKSIPAEVGAINNIKSSITHTASLALFDKIEVLSNVAKSQAQQATSEADLVELRGKVANEVEENYFNYQKAMTMVTASLSKIKFREKDLEINRAKQMMDEIPLSQVLSSELQLGTERVEYVKALADYYIAISGLFKAMGLAK